MHLLACNISAAWFSQIPASLSMRQVWDLECGGKRQPLDVLLASLLAEVQDFPDNQ